MSGSAVDPSAPGDRGSSGPDGNHASSWSLGEAATCVAVLVGGGLAAGSWAAEVVPDSSTSLVCTLVVTALLMCVYLAVGALVWWLARRKPGGFKRALALAPVTSTTALKAAILSVLAGRVAAVAWVMFLDRFDFDVTGMDVDPTSVFGESVLGTIALVAITVLIAPVAEEIVFRGVLQSALTPRVGPVAAIGVSAGVFAAAHLTGAAIPTVFVLGMVLGYVRYRHGTVAAVIGHAAFNLSSVALLWVVRSAGLL